MRLALAALLVVVSLAATSPRPAVAATCAPTIGPGIPPPAQVSGGIPGFHSRWYGQSGYMRLCAGERATATVAYMNTGSRGWVQGRMGEAAYLGTWHWEPGQDQPSILGGDGTRGSPDTGWIRYDRPAAQPAAYVGPAQVAWFQFAVQAPATPGTYRLGIRPLVEGATWLEDEGVFWEVTVLNDDGSVPPATPADPAGFVVVPAPGLDARDIHDVHEGVARVARFLAARLGGDRTHPVVANVRVGVGGEQYCCTANGLSFDIVTSHPAFRTPNAAQPDTWTVSTERKELAAHEYVHLWQYGVGGSACMTAPRWLSEGMPEAFAYGALVADGIIPATNLDTFIRRQLRTGTYAPLASLETSWPASSNPFAVAYLAVDRLLAQPTPLRLRQFCARVGAGEPWRDAFATVFGERVDSFYSRFEAFRAEYVR